ncbi:hypothetical protein E2562_022468 [Oryza meyeriana var. granulata]|uniref:Uncharacterized protein n=1 Tax=Oryza meyeriana var. granulata TaxID=110450 RepID=A0A6G1BMV5_9ORYZ|nr:hypothetical protein E2562_022468 [Oryza meyeriana var. granulata]
MPTRRAFPTADEWSQSAVGLAEFADREAARRGTVNSGGQWVSSGSQGRAGGSRGAQRLSRGPSSPAAAGIGAERRWPVVELVRKET